MSGARERSLMGLIFRALGSWAACMACLLACIDGC